MRQRRTLYTAVLLVAFCLVVAPRLRAHGIGTPQAMNVESGPYLLSVWSDPDPLRLDQTHLVVAVMDPATREPLIEDVDVSVRLERPGDPASAQTESAEADNTVNQLLYVVSFADLPTTGQWQATVIVDGARGLANDLVIPLTIAPPQRFSWVQVGLGGLVVITLGWLFLASLQASAHATARSAAARRRVLKGR